jgi:hypothetical protein
MMVLMPKLRAAVLERTHTTRYVTFNVHLYFFAWVIAACLSPIWMSDRRISAYHTALLLAEVAVATRVPHAAAMS